MQMDNMPSNLSLRLFDFCKGCDQFDTNDITFYMDTTTHHTITCRHINACGRMKEKTEGNDNAE